jgi:hypothetical protein
MNSVHFCSITLSSNQMHYFYYLKLKNYLQYIALIHYKLSLVFKIYPTCFGASLAPSSGVSLNQISCLVDLLLGMLYSCCSVVLFVSPLPHCRDTLLVSRVCSVPHLPCTTYLTEGQLSKKFGLKTPLKMAPKHVG